METLLKAVRKLGLAQKFVVQHAYLHHLRRLLRRQKNELE
ncbi:Uncharacterised protein [Vibrio cholerae]|uniref:Uncharacterized protein n=1 Tax=Vibrio cholerae TaxID=666 RepID=A0A656AP20_VIBCL|nr:Uncharacterised protein [Vibrio cholerae]CSD24122.1 Uncharacterised protein [Vibrio cholerae]